MNSWPQPGQGPAPAGTSPAASGFVISRVVHLASAALPGAGAFTAQPYSALPLGTKNVTYWITYTRGAAGGRPQFRAQWQNGTETDASETILDSSSLLTGSPFASVNFYDENDIGPVPADASAIVYVLKFTVPDAATGCRLLAAEVGVVGTPGTLAIALTGSG